jgi:hypothetical protein
MTLRFTPILAVILSSAACCAGELASHGDLERMFRTEKFTLLYHVRDVSARDWTAAGIHPCPTGGNRISDSIVDPGHAWASQDYMLGPCRLLLVAKNTQHEILSYWEATQGGPMLRVLVLRRQPKPKLFFCAVMHNDIPSERWTWAEITGHILRRKFDAIMP